MLGKWEDWHYGEHHREDQGVRFVEMVLRKHEIDASRIEDEMRRTQSEMRSLIRPKGR